MKRCRFCNKDNKDNTTICNCGYNFEEGEITDQNDKIIQWWKSSKNCFERAEKSRKIHYFQKNNAKIIKKPNDPHPEWTRNKTAKLLNVNHPTIITCEFNS